MFFFSTEKKEFDTEKKRFRTEKLKIDTKKNENDTKIFKFPIDLVFFVPKKKGIGIESIIFCVDFQN